MFTSLSRIDFRFALCIFAMLILGWFVFKPGLGGTYLLDDWHNLSGLESISDTKSAIQFVVSGGAGPLGRPLALASFLPQAELWGGPAEPFLAVNLLIHLCNGFLASLFFWQLARSSSLTRLDATWVAVAGAAIWMFMPLLASSTFMVVQRMATLAATWMLLAVNAYLFARVRLDIQPKAALVGMSFALILGTILAVLTKENGALLPTLVLVLESTVLARPEVLARGPWRYWRAAFMVIPTLVVLTALGAQLPYADETILQRGFTGSERLMTEAVILWEYLFRGLIAKPWLLGPFHDDHGIVNSTQDFGAFLAVSCWLAIIAAAILYRRRFSVASLAVLWFVGGHLLESTTIPLDLYFEHRNYMPMLGPAFALSWVAVRISGQYRYLATIALCAYVVANVGVTFSVSTLWGNPQVAAPYWSANAPKSPYAASHLARQQMQDVSMDLGHVTLREFSAANPDFAYLQIPLLTTKCTTRPGRDKGRLVASLEEALGAVSYSPSVWPMLDNLIDATVSHDCVDVPVSTVRKLVDSTFSNPRYGATAADVSYYHQLLAKIARSEGDTTEMIRQLSLANAADHNRNVQVMLITSLAANDQVGNAKEVLLNAESNLPLNPAQRISDEMTNKELRRYLEAFDARTRLSTDQ